MEQKSFCEKCQNVTEHKVISSGGILTPRRQITITELVCNQCQTKKTQQHEEKNTKHRLLDG